MWSATIGSCRPMLFDHLQKGDPEWGDRWGVRSIGGVHGLYLALADKTIRLKRGVDVFDGPSVFAGEGLHQNLMLGGHAERRAPLGLTTRWVLGEFQNAQMER